MNVAGKRVKWEEGKVAVIQNAYPHHTWNKTEHDRVVLYFDHWHPDLTRDERRGLEIFTAVKAESEVAEFERRKAMGGGEHGPVGDGPARGMPPGMEGMPPVDDPKLLELLKRFG